jgi:calcium channel MID1
MYLPKFTLLQSRFAASVGATIFLLFLLYSLNHPAVAYAEATSATRPEAGLNILGRQEQGQAPLVLGNNAPMSQPIVAGQGQFWRVDKDTIDGPAGRQGLQLPSSTGDNSSTPTADDEEREGLRKRQARKAIFVTVTTCEQPIYNGSDPSSDDAVPPQLSVYASQSPDNTRPGPDSSDDQKSVVLDGGYGLIELDDDETVMIGVFAPNNTRFTGEWNYQIAVSIDAPFHRSLSQTPNLHFVDADTRAALLITDDLTSAQSNESSFADWMALDPPPYGMFVYPASLRSIEGVQNSYCGLRMLQGGLFTNLENSVNQNIAVMTDRGLGGKPKEQFYVTGLNASSEYVGILAQQPRLANASLSSDIGSGGTVWRSVQFSTKSMDNCALMYNLTFCSEVAYAVPTNPERFSTRDGLPELAKIYDNYAQSMYQYFNYSLQQIPCNTSETSAYSLVRDCDSCARAYKTWLCAVTIPRCEDYTNPAAWLKPRNVGQPFPNGSTTSIVPGFAESQQILAQAVATNSSRSLVIDEQISPGPYKEVLPCKDLCYDLVQSCPAALQFSCPTPGKGLEDGYGERSDNSGNLSCSYLGAAFFLSASTTINVPWEMLALATLSALLLLFA